MISNDSRLAINAAACALREFLTENGVIAVKVGRYFNVSTGLHGIWAEVEDGRRAFTPVVKAR